MGSIMDRKAAQFWWNEISKLNIDIPRDVSYYKKDMYDREWIPVTWSEIHADRTSKIRENISRKRSHEQIKPCIIWVFHVDFWIMGGTYTMIKTLNKEFYLNFRTESKYLQARIMQEFPIVLPMEECFNSWMVAFMKAYKNKTFYKNRKNQGVALGYCKLDKYNNLIDIFSKRPNN